MITIEMCGASIAFTTLWIGSGERLINVYRKAFIFVYTYIQ